MQTAVSLLPIAFLVALYFLTLWFLDQRAKGKKHGDGFLVVFAALAALWTYFSMKWVPPLAKVWLNSNPPASAASGLVGAFLVGFAFNSWINYYFKKGRPGTANFVLVVMNVVVSLIAAFGLFGLILLFTGAQI